MCEFHDSNGNGFGDISWTDKLFYFSSIDDPYLSVARHIILTYLNRINVYYVIGPPCLLIQLALNASTFDGWTGVCVMRFVGATIASDTADQLVQSITDQVSLMCRLPYTSTYKVNMQSEVPFHQ